MNEIEIKVRVADPEIIRGRLRAIGCILSIAKRQEDVVFVHGSMKKYEVKEGTVVLRTRDEDGKTTLTLKRQLSSPLSSEEYEVEVSSSESIHLMLAAMGFRELVRVNKTRMTSFYGAFKICIDEVQHLGTFLEVESVTERNDYTVVQEEMYETLLNLGIEFIEKVTVPYDTQLYRLIESTRSLRRD